MEGKGRSKVVLTLLLTFFISQSLQNELVNQKTYYSPPSDPHTVAPPHHVPGPPRHHRTPACPPPPHGSNCGCTPAPAHGGGSPPSHGGGGYYNSPPPTPLSPTPTIPTGPPSTPTIPTGPPSTPTIPIGPPSTPTTPLSPPSTPLIPVDPNTPPFNPGGSPPFIPVDPNSPPLTPGGTPGTCIFWSTNPTIVWGIFGYWATIGGLFGPTTTLPFGSNLSVQDALANTRHDGFGALYREGVASFLNSMIVKRFPFTTEQVRKAFVNSMGNEKTAANQARIFKLANEGRLKNH